MPEKCKNRLDAIHCLELGDAHSVEQWLGVYEVDGFRIIKWLRIVRESGPIWSVYGKTVLDMGSVEFCNIDEFEEVGDPDAPEGSRAIFDTAEEALNYAETLGAQETEFVPWGGIGSIYRDFIRETGVAKKGIGDWFTET